MCVCPQGPRRCRCARETLYRGYDTGLSNVSIRDAVLVGNGRWLSCMTSLPIMYYLAVCMAHFYCTQALCQLIRVRVQGVCSARPSAMQVSATETLDRLGLIDVWIWMCDATRTGNGCGCLAWLRPSSVFVFVEPARFCCTRQVS